jgi:hypothetical protein
MLKFEFGSVHRFAKWHISIAVRRLGKRTLFGCNFHSAKVERATNVGEIKIIDPENQGRLISECKHKGISTYALNSDVFAGCGLGG